MSQLDSNIDGLKKLPSSPAQVLAALEGVSVVTIRNRLHSAREQGLLEKPGSGKRSAKKS